MPVSLAWSAGLLFETWRRRTERPGVRRETYCRRESGSETRNNDGYRYFPAGGSDKPVVSVAHTHRSGPDPSEQDSTTLRDGITSAIYYQGTMYKFDKNGRIK